jgi:hypothetical protein
MAQARYLLFGLVLANFSHVADRHPQMLTQDQQFQEIFKIRDSWPVFSLYLKIAAEEDDAMAERWKTNADGVLIFVSLCASIHISTHQLYFYRVVYSLPLLLHCSA